MRLSSTKLKFKLKRSLAIISPQFDFNGMLQVTKSNRRSINKSSYGKVDSGNSLDFGTSGRHSIQLASEWLTGNTAGGAALLVVSAPGVARLIF